MSQCVLAGFIDSYWMPVKSSSIADSPPLTTPLVQMADMDRPVMVVTTQLRAMTTMPRPEHQHMELLQMMILNWCVNVSRS